MRPIRSVIAVATAAAAVSLVAVAPAANAADLTWVQQYQRPSADAACADQTGQTPWQSTYTGQSNWTPSWAQWANGGRGGWVCTRIITWGTEEAPVEVLVY